MSGSRSRQMRVRAIQNSIHDYIEKSVEEILSIGLKLNFSKWVPFFRGGVVSTLSLEGSSAITKGGIEENYFVKSCDPLGAITFIDHKKNMDLLPKEDRSPIPSIGIAGRARILSRAAGCDWIIRPQEFDFYDWVVCFGAGWDLSGYTSEYEPEYHVHKRVYDAYSFGNSVREKYKHLDKDPYKGE